MKNQTQGATVWTCCPEQRLILETLYHISALKCFVKKQLPINVIIYHLWNVLLKNNYLLNLYQLWNILLQTNYLFYYLSALKCFVKKQLPINFIIYQLWNVLLQTNYVLLHNYQLWNVLFKTSYLSAKFPFLSLSFMFKTRCVWTVNSTRLHWVTRQLTSNSHEAKICVGGMSSEGGGDDMLSGVTPRFSLICNKSCLNNKLNTMNPAHSPPLHPTFRRCPFFFFRKG